MSDDKPLDDVREAAAQIVSVWASVPIAEARRLVIMLSGFAENLVATAAAQPAVRERVAKEQEEEIARLRTALEKLSKLGNEPFYGNSIGNQIARAALAQEG